jgi:hypothetical protein
MRTAQQPVPAPRPITFDRTIHDNTNALIFLARHIKQVPELIRRDRLPTGINHIFAPPVTFDSATTNLNVCFRRDLFDLLCTGFA